MTDLRVDGAADADQPSRSDQSQAAARLAEEALQDGDVREAREIVQEALNAGGSRADLLWALADVEFADGRVVEGRKRLTEAADACGGDATAVARQILALRRNHLWRETLLLVESIPTDVCRDRLVRAEVGGFYRACGCPAHAVDGYGPRDGLPRPAGAARRRCWLRSGGPSKRIRQRVGAWEESKLLSLLRRPVRYAGQLNNVPGLEDREAQRLRTQIETLEYRQRRLGAGWIAAMRVAYRLLPAAVLPVWLVLFVIIDQVGFAAGPGGAVGGAAVTAVIATVPVFLLVTGLFRPDLEPRFKLRGSHHVVLVYFFAAGVFEAAVAEGYDHNVLPTTGWWCWVVLGLVAVPATIACVPIAGLIANGLWWWQLRTLIREDCLLVVLDVLLGILDDLRTPPGHRHLSQGLTNAWRLEFAARRLTRDLLPTGVTSYLGSGDWLNRRVAGWGEALRQMQRQMVAPVPGSQTKLEATLAHEIGCLATCDLGALAWRQPPPRPPRRTVLGRQAITTLRTIVVAGLPLAVVLAVQPFLHASPGLFGWARIATGIWAVLYVLLSLDPAIRDKLDTAHSMVGLLHNPRSMNRPDNPEH